MARRVAYLAGVVGLGLSLAGCAFSFMGMEQRASWREDAEKACFQRRDVIASPFIQRVKEVDGRGACGIDFPWQVSAVLGGTVAVGPSATLGCPITEALEGWMRDSVQPAAIAWFGQPVVAIKQISDYSCRSRNNAHRAKLSEHAFGNAVDVASFKLANGRVITVKGGWRGSRDEQQFLREVAARACASFTTFLGPGAAHHSDHFHIDLAKHGKKGISRYCKPIPQVVPPARPRYDGSRYAAIPGQPRYDSIEDLAAYTGSIHATDGIPDNEAADPFGVYDMRETAGMAYAK
jgi:hypothetical protein